MGPADMKTNARKIASLKRQIRDLRPRAETGEQWAHICLLADQVIALGGEV
jgi:hypothetical protein